MNVLLVDDEEMMRKMLKLMLQKRGLQVFDAADGPAAMALAERHPVEVLVTDIVMPGIDGWTLARLLLQRNPGLPVVFTSGCPVDWERNQPEHARCAFLPKPFQPRDLMQVISDLTCAPV